MGLKRKNDELEDIDVAKLSKLDPPSPEAGRREKQGQGENKHSIDSDDEDEDRAAFSKFDKMDDNDIEGQEDNTVTADGEIQITPFNLKEEQEEGSFSKDGNFVWNKRDEVKDAWLDDVDWVKVKEKSAAEVQKEEEDAEAEDEANSQYDEFACYKQMVQLMKPGESVAKALRRLGGGHKAQSASQRWKKKKKADEVEDPAAKENKENMLKLTGMADEILTRSGNMEIYEETYEGILFKVKSVEKKEPTEKPSIPDNVDDDAALDMFADYLDGDKKEEPTSKSVSESKDVAVLNEVFWEFKWKSDDGELHGPHDSQKMLDWQESGYFDSGVMVRKVGTEEFWDSKRVDFELYLGD